MIIAIKEAKTSMNIHFEKTARLHQQEVFRWLANPHVQEFWDNSDEHKQDILIFMDGRKIPSPYFGGIFDYWIGLIDNEPFALIMTSEILFSDDLPDEWRPYLSKSGKTISIDFMIGNEKYVGKGLAVPALQQFTDFFRREIDSQAYTFIIDPAQANTRAEHVYEKAGFKKVCAFVRDNKPYWLMVKKM